MSSPSDSEMAKSILGGGDAPGDDKGEDPLMSAADDLIAAVHGKDSAGVADALKAAFQMMESEPHEEAPPSE